MKTNRYQILAVTTLIATLFLIFVGGLVRAAGAGLGCPDWPTCFGMWIPPLTADALPTGYDAELFNPFHTWLEYVNRLVGVLIGLLISLTFFFSFRYRKSDPVIPVSAGIAFLLVLFQGWLGGQVVRSGLSAWMITVHMITALVIVNILLFTAWRTFEPKPELRLSSSMKQGLFLIVSILLGLVMIQMVLGTQVRELIDVVKNSPSPPPREYWLDRIEGSLYFAHRSFSWLIVGVTGWLWLTFRPLRENSALRNLTLAVVVLVMLQIVFGVGLEQFGMPGMFQVLHLTSASFLVCALFLYLLFLGSAEAEGNPE